jgi:phospholipase C
LDNLKHIVVLMMNGRSFDHMLGAMRSVDPRIDGLTGNESNPDSNGALVRVQPLATFQGQFTTDPATYFAAVDLQIFGGSPRDGHAANMQGFVKSYYQQQKDVDRSHRVMYYFTPDKLPVLASLASEFAVFNRWFSSVPGPTICNRAFAHYGTSFGSVGMNLFYATDSIPSVYERLVNGGHSAKIYYFDLQSSSLGGTANLAGNKPQFFSSFEQFLRDCKAGLLPDYSFLEPNYVDHVSSDGGVLPASDQHPVHHVQEGERFIAVVYNAIRTNPKLWRSTALLIVYDQHGGIYDHVAPPVCVPDGYFAKPDATGTSESFSFNRLGVRVPAVLISPWVPRGTVVSPLQQDDPLDNERIFEHASIPASVTNFFMKDFDKRFPNQRSPREMQAATFLDLLSLPSPRTVDLSFDLGD